MSIDIDLFAPSYVLPEHVATVLGEAQATFAGVTETVLVESASFSEHYLSRRKAQQLAEQVSTQLCGAFRSKQAITQVLERSGRELAEAGLLREPVARLTVAWIDAGTTLAHNTAPVEQSTAWVIAAASLLGRATASLQAGFEEGRRLRILEQQQGMREAFRVALSEHEEQEQRLLDLIQVLSTPVVPVLEGILILPLIGTIDSRRAGQITEQVLTAISREHAQTLIMDITGVIAVDTQTAQVLLQAAQASRLLGAETLLVGITPEVAQTIVGLGLDMNGVRTFADLQSGVMHALAQRGMRIVRQTLPQTTRNIA